MTPYFRPTRRDLLRIGGGFGALALSRVFADAGLLAAETASSARQINPLAPKVPHFAPRAKRLIFLFMQTLSDVHNHSFGQAYGVLIEGLPLPLLSRAVFVVDKNGTITYAEYVPEVTSHPNYDQAAAALKAAL